jgi:hypothetical protein
MPNVNIILANLIRLFHISIILFVLLAPITSVSYYLILHITLCISLIIHWLANNNMCSLSIVESQLRGIPYTDSFTHQFISPMYDMSKTSWSSICYIIVLLVMSISIYKLYTSGKIRTTYIIYKSQREKNIPFLDIYNNCLKELFH